MKGLLRLPLVPQQLALDSDFIATSGFGRQPSNISDHFL
jgi:hypothetical protein